MAVIEILDLTVDLASLYMCLESNVMQVIFIYNIDPSTVISYILG